MWDPLHQSWQVHALYILAVNHLSKITFASQEQNTSAASIQATVMCARQRDMTIEEKALRAWFFGHMFALPNGKLKMSGERLIERNLSMHSMHGWLAHPC